MKTINKTGAIMTLVLISLFGCQDTIENPDELIPGEVQFSLGDREGGIRGDASGAEGLADARALVVTIIDDQGNVVYDQEHVELLNFSGTLVGEPLSLNPGDYQLTEFLVLDDQGVVIYATPIEGSEYAHLVNDPLPIEFTVVTDVVTEVVPEVIDVEEFTPDAFGYATFRFTIIEHFSFLITSFVFDEGEQKLSPASANLIIYQQGTANVVYNDTMGDSTNAIAVPDSFDYRLVVEKAGYSSFAANYTNAELKNFEDDPLEIVLQETEAMPSERFVDSGQTFSSLGGSSVTAADVDGDGDLDLFIARANGQPTEVLLNDGNGNYTESNLVVNFNSTYAALGDIDNDGDLDAFITNWSDQPNTVWFNDGIGNYTDSGQQLGTSSTSGVVLVDLDDDGDLDAIVNDFYSLPILINDGNGVFTEVSQITGNLEAIDIALGDLNGDGNLDLFVANYQLPDVVLLNDGTGNFIDSGQNLGNGNSRGLALADIDGDSDLDAIVGAEQQASTVWLNNGAGVFTDGGQALGNDIILDVIVVDFDLDGDLDAFTVTNNQPQILWWNDGSGNFSNSGQTFGSNAATSLTSGDFDLDGDIDIFITINTVSDILWLGAQN